MVVGHTYAIVQLVEDNRGERSVRLRSRELARTWKEGVVSEPKIVNEKATAELEDKEKDSENAEEEAVAAGRQKRGARERGDAAE